MKRFDELKTEHFSSLPSTSLYAANLIRLGLDMPDLIWADRQTDGQGRRGRSFFSPDKTGLYFTFCLPLSDVPQDGLTPRVALAVREAIRREYGLACGIKWVNDLYLNGKKVCGILCQVVGDFVLIGIGINLVPPKSVPEDIKDRFGALFDQMPENPERLIQTIYECLNLYFNTDHAAVLSAYQAALIHIGKPVMMTFNQGKISGNCIGIDDQFHLLLETETGVRSFSSGYASLFLSE